MELGMSIKFKPFWVVCAGLLASPAAVAVDLVGVHDLVLKSDPRLQAAEYRRQATGESKTQAWANLLPQLGAGASWNKGSSTTSFGVPDVEDVENNRETRNYEISLGQSLYRQANYEQLDIARGQIRFTK
jgi:outer membrane protein